MQIEQTLDSREVAEMIGKKHYNLMRDVRSYVEEFIELKIEFNEFFRENTYKDNRGRLLPCYDITKKGCEFIAHKLTGIKGTEFTARYINRFHEMHQLSNRNKRTLPWFVRWFRGDYVILQRDFSSITGVDLDKQKKFFSPEYFSIGFDWNGYGWKEDNEKFKREYGFDYGTEDCLFYLTIPGVKKALRILRNDKTKMNAGSYEMIMGAVTMIQTAQWEAVKAAKKKAGANISDNGSRPVQVTIYLNGIDENSKLSCQIM